MRKTMMGWAATTFVVTAVLAGPSEARSQSSPGTQMAVELESQASELHDQRDRWAEAANLYLAAAQLRQHEDPQAQKDLFLAANLWYGIGDRTGAIAALESAGTRARASGDVETAAELFARGAWIAREARLPLDERRLRYKAVALSKASDLTSAERREILSRISGE